MSAIRGVARRARVGAGRGAAGARVGALDVPLAGVLVVALVAVAAFAPSAVAATSEVRSETVVLTSATVHTVSGPVIEHANLVIDGGKIVAVGADVRVPIGAKVVPSAGRHVYPGFIAPNTILGLTEVGSVRGSNDYQEIGNINPDIRAEVEVNPESELIPAARVNGVTSAVILPRGGTIAGTAALMHLDGWTREDMTIAAPLGLFVQWPSGSRQREFGPPTPEDQRRRNRDQQIEELRRAFDDARAYWKARDAEASPGIPRHDRDVKWEAMGPALKGQVPVMFQASSLEQIRGVLRFVEDQKLTRVLIVGGGDAWRVADELKAKKIGVITGATLALPARRYEAYDDAYALPGKLAAAGVDFCISDGGGSMAAMNARNLPYQAAMAAAFGLDREEALKSITLYPARLLGVADKLGSIEPGKIADLVVTDGDPLEITTKVLQVYINGKPISMETRQTRLFQKYDARPRGALARPR